MAKRKKHESHEHHDHHDHHKHEKKTKRRSGCLPLLILLLLLALAAWFLINHFGLFGIGDGDGDGKSGDGGDKSSTSQSETTEIEEIKLEVTVSGEKYIFDNKTISLDDFINEVRKPEGKVIVHITCDDDAVDDTVNKLKEKLETEKILFVEEAQSV